MKLAVIGSGAWGTALAIALVENKHDVTLWSYSEQECQQMATTKENIFLKGVTLPDALSYSNDLSCASGCPVVVMAVPSFAVRSTAHALAPHLDPNAVVVTVSKGIEQDTSLTLGQVIEQEIGENHPVVAFSGPSHAEEVSRKIPTAIVSASTNKEAAELVQNLFMSQCLRVYASDDIMGAELGGALKNIIALCAGICDGLGCGDNTKAALMTRGLAEMARLGVAMGGRKESFAGLTGVGDLIVTCTSMHSRNRRAGILIGQGTPVEEALKEVGAVVEGYYATATARTLAQKLGVEMPIAEASYQMLYEGKNAQDIIADLMNREPKHELENSWI